MRILQSKAISRIGARAGLAFSRNGPKKVYIQYKMLEDSEALAKMLVRWQSGFYWCGTLGMLLKIYLAESHGREGGTLANSNISGDFLAYPIACQIIDSVITVLGPDIQESTRTSGLVQNLGGCDVETSTTIQDRVIGTIHGLRSNKTWDQLWKRLNEWKGKQICLNHFHPLEQPLTKLVTPRTRIFTTRKPNGRPSRLHNNRRFQNNIHERDFGKNTMVRCSKIWHWQ